jgi:FRG domain
LLRGQSEIAWQRNAGILRPENGDLLRQEREVVREMISLHPEEFRDDITMFDRLARIQHFGLPTRLLDITLNPLAALYFASKADSDTSDEHDGLVECYPRWLSYFDDVRVSVKANLANLAAVEKDQLMDASSPSLNDTLNRLLGLVRIEHPECDIETVKRWVSGKVFVMPKRSNRRIVAQAGAFLLFGLPLPRIGYDADRYMIRIPIPKEEKAGIRRDLDLLGVNENTLFPELERTAAAIKARFGRRTPSIIKDDHA